MNSYISPLLTMDMSFYSSAQILPSPLSYDPIASLLASSHLLSFEDMDLLVESITLLSITNILLLLESS